MPAMASAADDRAKRAGPVAATLARAMVLAVTLAAGTAWAQGDAATGRRLAQERGCASCHDPSGLADAEGVPYLAGQKRDYMVRQMAEFRERRARVPGPGKTAERTHPIMDPKTAPLSNAEIGHLAEYYASLPCVPRRSFDEADVERPEMLHRCQFCHGDKGVTPYPSYPNIGGQKKDYLVRQLKDFRKSANHGTVEMWKQKDERFHRTMAPTIYEISDDAITALADYYSKQSCQ